MAPYDGSGGVVHYTFKGGTANVARDPYITLFGQGTETDVVATTDANNINGVTELGTAAADNDSVGIAFPNAYRPGIMEDGRLRDAGGTGIVKARFGFDARATASSSWALSRGALGVL